MKIYLFFSFLLFSLLSFAQENNLIKRIDWSEKHFLSRSLQLVNVIPHKEGFYTVRESKYKEAPILIGIYDKSMYSKKEIGFNPRAKGRNWRYEGLFWINNQFHLFSSFYDVEKSQNILYQQDVKQIKEGLEIKKELQEMAAFPIQNKYNLGEFEILQAESGAAIIVCSVLPSRSTKAMLQLHFLDEQLIEKSNVNIILPYEKERLEIVEKRIDESGNFYLLSRLYKKGRVNRRNGTPNYEYLLMRYPKGKDQPITYHLNLDNYLITDLKFDLLENNEVVLVGLISDAGNAKTNGICYFKANTKQSNLQLETKSLFQTTPITLAAAQTSTSEEIKIPRYLKIDHLFPRSDGGILMIAERSFQVSKYTYQDDDIVIVNINPKGVIDWVAQIPKKQSSYRTEDVLLSYFPFIVQDKIYLIYNDDGRNFSYNKQRKRVQRHKIVKGYAALTEIQKDGTWRSYPLSDNSIADLVIHPQSCKQIGRKTILVYAAFGNTYRFGELELK